MKTFKFLAYFIFSSFCTGLMAQNAAVTNAVLYQQDGNLVKAKQQIDLAIEHEKTKNSPKTWYYKGLIYSDIFKSEDVNMKQLAVDPLVSSTEAFQRVISLEGNEKGEFTTLAKNKLEENWVNLVNRGIAYYQTLKHKNALDMFQIAQKIKENDTTAYVYGAYAAEAIGYDSLVQLYCNKLLNINYKTIYVYSKTITYSIDKKEFTKAIELANKGLVEFPLDKNLLEFRTLAYIQSKMVQEGIGVLLNDLKTSPYNVDLNTNLAVLYNESQDINNALLVYNKIIAIEPHNYFANFNAAVIHLNKGNELAQKNDKSGAIAYFKKSLENAKRAKALASEDDDVDTLSRLINELNTLINQ